MKHFVVNNVRPDELNATINEYAKKGWTLHSTVLVSGPGIIGVVFTVIFSKGASV